MMIFLGVLFFALLIIVHEYGHYKVAKRNGVEVEEFGIGFPPRLFSKQVGDTLYSFNLIPLGGFVKLKGESNSSEEPGGFGASSLWVKAKILLAGVGMNVMSAIVIVAVLALIGLPKILPNQFSIESNETISSSYVVAAQVVEDSAADEAGIVNGDKILAIDDTDITSAEELSDTTASLSGETVNIRLLRDEQETVVNVVLGNDPDEGYLGVLPVDLESSRYTWAAPIVAVGLTFQMIGMVLIALWDILSGLFTATGGEAVDQLVGPVGIVFLLQNLGELGLSYLMILIASISVSLAVFNALPIPALDGGRLFLILAAKSLRKNLTEKVENAVHGLGFILLMGLFILITYVDVQRFF
ncbi:MAG: M50 family metallopeptidase [Candidatus Saccharimonadales bacterium]